MTSWGFWTLVAAGVVTWAGVQNGFGPGMLIVVAIPLIPVLLNAWMYAKADFVVAKVAERQASVSPDRGRDA